MNRTQRQLRFGAQARQYIQRESDISLENNLVELYGGVHSAPLFSPYHERPLMSFSMVGAYHPLLDWVGWRPTTEYLVRKGFLNYMAADGTAGDSPTSGVVSDPCAPGNTIEFGLCDYQMTGFGRLRRETPARSDDTVGITYHNLIDPHRVDGSVIRDEREFDMLIVTSVLVQDLHRELITGDSSNAGEFDGFQQLIVHGYTDTQSNSCNAMDATVIDWDGKDMAEAVSNAVAGQITVNGAAIPDGTYNLYDMLAWTIRRIRIRLGHAPMLRNNLRRGEVVLAMPNSWIRPFLNVVTCYQKCGGDFAKMTTEAALTFFNGLWNNSEADELAQAEINIEGVPVVITGYDYELINNDGTADMYLLVKGNNGMDFIYGEFLDQAKTVEQDPNRYSATDNNMLLTYRYYDQTCSKRVVQAQARLHMPAPWAQVRIQNVPYEGVFNAMSVDPQSSYFFSDTIVSGPVTS